MAENSGFLQRNSMMSYHVFFRKNPNNIAFSRINLSNNPFTIEDLQPSPTLIDDGILRVKPGSVYFDS